MTVRRDEEYLVGLVRELCGLPAETEWVEFKQNTAEPEKIGEYISALANSAALLGKVNAYMVWGVRDEGHAVTGTRFRPSRAKVGKEELENWLLHLLEPKTSFRFHELAVDDKPVVLLEIDATAGSPVQFKGQEFIRVGSYKKKLKAHPERERDLWRAFNQTPFEKQVAAGDLVAEDALRFLDYPAYFDRLRLPLPRQRQGILEALEADGMIARGRRGRWDITNLGAVLFAKDLGEFNGLARKAMRVVVYKDNSHVDTVREHVEGKGYASGFDSLMDSVRTLLPAHEVIEQAVRREVLMFPAIAVRELIANALIHQDFQATGTGPMVEIFPNRLEVTNPGAPLVATTRFLDSPPESRNEGLASFMRRIGLCEERGTGVDKVVTQTEAYQLPAPLFEEYSRHTRCTLFAHREFKDMGKNDRIRAAYLHACLRYVRRDYMTNSSLRERFGIGKRSSAMVSRVIKDAVDAGEIKPFDEEAPRKYMRYLPVWG